MRFILFFLLSVFISNAFSNEKFFYVLGGGGDPKGDSTIFDEDVKKLGKFSSNSNWKTIISFDGGHAKTEGILKEKFKNASNMGDFVESNLNNVLKDMTEKLSSMKPGDQLMIALNTHGAIKDGKQLSHNVAYARNAATELTNLKGADQLDLDKLKPVIDLAKKNGVKLAFIDQSCHSGASLNLGGDDVCIISASGDKHYGYSGDVDLFFFSIPVTFSGKFFGEMKAGKNLEEIFLSVRDGDTQDFPMISTKTGRQVQGMLYDLITPYLYYNDNQGTKLDNQYTVKNINAKSCELENNHAELISKISEISKMKDFASSIQLFSNLKNALEEYRNYQRRYEDSYKGLSRVSDEVKEIIHRDYSNQEKLFKDIEGYSILNSNYDSSIEFWEKYYKEANNDFTRKYRKEMLDDSLLRKKIANEIKTKLSPSSLKAIDYQKDFFGKSGVSQKYARNVSIEAKKLYKLLYEKNTNKNELNPCKDFVL